MAVGYEKLWNLLIDKEMKRSEIMEKAGIMSNVLSRLSKNELVFLSSLAKICSLLGCNFGNIIEYKLKHDTPI